MSSEMRTAIAMNISSIFCYKHVYILSKYIFLFSCWFKYAILIVNFVSQYLSCSISKQKSENLSTIIKFISFFRSTYNRFHKKRWKNIELSHFEN